jgi:uncharacterized protein
VRHYLLCFGMGTALLAANACSPEPSLALALVAARNAADTVRELLKQGHAPDERDPRGLTPLMWAARAGSLDAMSALLDGGADPNARDAANGWTPLLHAIHKNQAAAAQLLLDRGADPNLASGLLTPLMMAAPDPDPEIVKILLAYGANPAARGYGGSTALTYAVSGGAISDIDRPLLGGCRPKTVEALLEHDPTLALPDTIAGHNALWWAHFHGCDSVLERVNTKSDRKG